MNTGWCNVDVVKALLEGNNKCTDKKTEGEYFLLALLSSSLSLHVYFPMKIFFNQTTLGGGGAFQWVLLRPSIMKYRSSNVVHGHYRGR